MAKCANCGGTNSTGCSCAVGDAGDGGAFNTPSIVQSGSGTPSSPFRFALAGQGYSGVAIVPPGLTLGAGGTALAAMQRAGKEVTYEVLITLAAGFALPNPVVVPLDATLPMRGPVPAAGRVIGLGTLIDVSASTNYELVMCSDGVGTSVQVYALGASGQLVPLTAVAPIALAAGDRIDVYLKYTTV